MTGKPRLTLTGRVFFIQRISGKGKNRYAFVCPKERMNDIIIKLNFAFTEHIYVPLSLWDLVCALRFTVVSYCLRLRKTSLSRYYAALCVVPFGNRSKRRFSYFLYYG